MDVDDLFKASGSISKRKLDQPIRDPNEIYKASKLSDSSHPHAQAEDDVDNNNTNNDNPADDDGDFGPELPPDDEEGRFFGGGISKQESEILDFVDKADAGGGDVDKLDSAWLRKTVLNLEKLINKNAELRSRYEDQPNKFIDSEADLDAEIKNLSLLAEASHLYGEFVKLGSAASLVGLLTHENTDIAIDAIEIIGELTDDDVVTETEQWDTLVGALIESDLLSLLVSNLSRFNEDDESDRNGVYHSLSVLENLSSQKAVATRMCEEDDLLKWLLQRIQRTESPILAILTAAAPENREKLLGGPEEEFVENLFEAKFLEAEGTELCLIMIKESKMAKHPSLRLLDHATAGTASVEICQRIVESGGLKTTFTLFNKTKDQRLVGPLLSIFSSMLRFLPADSAERIRLLAKFVEKEYEKTARLAVEEEHRQEAAARAGGAEEEEEDREIQLLSRKMDAGLFNLQLVDVILAWLVAEDGGARQKIQKLLAETDDDLKAIQRTLKEQLAELDTSEEDSKDLGDMLGTLIDFLD
ncbi:DUF1716-domain-containing protein [Trichoderma citrinoviride]|uniref:DUF1716-domain-containing protein n=1 Tax=Trichoderma citrinoviride TaxID=58853 RepID=A0A2T4BGG1_9HYPO|nr:DUF1716-domain-containing protein [Trichoderma citrinoviride]PTB68361.1 DUF1716-domain-containing protein [Trichoderma citrinoviride]